MKGYTVVGIYFDTNQPWVEFVEAETAEDAAREAVLAKRDAAEQLTTDNLGVVEVFEGHHEGRLVNDCIVTGSDYE